MLWRQLQRLKATPCQGALQAYRYSSGKHLLLQLQQSTSEGPHLALVLGPDNGRLQRCRQHGTQPITGHTDQVVSPQACT